MTARIRDLLAGAKRRLRTAAHAPPPREAHLLMAHVLGRSEAEVLAHDDEEAPAEPTRRFLELLERRLRGEPVAYLTGRREFYGRSFRVDSRVLIPRPESEHLIEAVLGLRLPERPTLLDLGTGSGCLAVTLALELPGALVLATDASPAALALARRNAIDLGAADRVRFLATDWAAAARLDRVDLACSNPPYIGLAETASLSPEITRYEPHAALFAAEDGVASYRALFASLAGLRRGTTVVCEIGRGQASVVRALATAAGFRPRRTLADYAGIARVVVVNRDRAERPGATRWTSTTGC
jgi:release factor glutamine methyltransferase